MDAATEQVGLATILESRPGAPTLSLVWKEWREQGWRLAFGCVVLVGFCAIGLRSRVIDDMTIVGISCFIGGLFLPVLAAMGAIGGDRESGGDAFLRALPVRPWRVLAVKTGMAWLACLTPILAAWWLVARTLVGQRAMTGGPTVDGFFFAQTWVALHLVVWTLAFGVRQPSEARVGLVGVLVVGAWILLVMPYMSGGPEGPSYMSTGPEGMSYRHTIGVLMGSITPISVCGWGFARYQPEFRRTMEWAGVAVLCALWGWALWRFSRAGRRAS